MEVCSRGWLSGEVHRGVHWVGSQCSWTQVATQSAFFGGSPKCFIVHKYAMLSLYFVYCQTACEEGADRFSPSCILLSRPVFNQQVVTQCCIIQQLIKLCHYLNRSKSYQRISIEISPLYYISASHIAPLYYLAVSQIALLDNIVVSHISLLYYVVVSHNLPLYNTAASHWLTHRYTI